ncbi:MAG: glycine cleavage system aminomethyltransferase GcvT [Planctomycetes bacterium]|nr:glycine cleavage system aminomethyltransferase GcvT [Planctomycetota bacterium]MCH8118300.1 glycine cleavage system aminomethyltransferase GcvT [Planctomycetota bacterium]
MLQNDANKSQLREAEKAPKQTVLYDQNVGLTDKSHIVSFAGYLMPLWYSSITSEHTAAREAAGIFDCTHMGVLEISGVDAAEFIDQLTTNSITNLKVKHAQYSFILDASGGVLDDVIVYRKDRDKFFVVVNAANNTKIKNWINALLKNRSQKSEVRRQKSEVGGQIICPLSSVICSLSYDCMVDIALQGPKSLDVFSVLTQNKETQSKIADLRPFQFMETDIKGIGCLISRTGYTGAKSGFELFVHPERASQLWETILQAGKPLGLLPCGLGSRDSLRIEAGLPLYGHELAGKFGISPFEAGYGWAVKLEKKFFIGKTAMERISREYDMKVARIELPGTKGIRPVRQNDGVLDKHGRSIGWVLSCARIGEKQIALVYVDRKSLEENDAVGLYYSARSRSHIQQGRKQSIDKGELLEPDLTGKVVVRFAKF